MNEESEFSRFNALLKKLVSVPKAEIAEKEKAYKKERKKIRKRRTKG